MSRDPYTLLCDVTAHALYSNGPFAYTKKTLAQYYCVARVLERTHRAAAQQQINCRSFITKLVQISVSII
jgi:hypothetical protein